MFRKLLCAAAIFSTLAVVACSNSSSDNKGGDGANQQGQPCTPDQQAIGAQPAPGFPGHADVMPPGLPGTNPAPQQPGAPQPGAQQPPQQQLSCSQAIQGSWQGAAQTLQNGVTVALSLEVQGSMMKVTLACSAANDRVQATANTRFELNGTTLTVLQGDRGETPFGQGSCSLEIKTGMAFQFMVRGNTLTLTKDGETSTFTRIGNPPQQGGPIGQQPMPGNPGQQPAPGNPGQQQGLFGYWSTGEMSQDAQLSAHMILKIDQGQMMAMAACIDRQTNQQVQAITYVPVTIDPHTITVNQDGQDSKPIGRNECSVNIPAGPYDYTLNGNSLTINTRNNQLQFTRFNPGN